MTFPSQIFSVFKHLKYHGKNLQRFWLKQKYLSQCNISTSWVIEQSDMHKSLERNTIYALSYPAVVVVRISGPDASKIFQKIARMRKLPEARKAVLCRLKDPDSDELLDKALALWFPSPNSYTGEDMCELHLHGSKPVINGVLNALQKLPHFRSAEPGEFTKRAFMAGKLDLTEVEGLADLLNAETEAQRRQALRQMDGGLHKLYTDWTDRVKRCSARLEAYIDFGEDQHLDETILTSVQKDLEILRNEISIHLQDHRKGEKVRSGVYTVITGRPNVGKSTLMNYLCQKDVAIVSPTAGTTRDTLEFCLNIDGYLVNFCDTAGIRESLDTIEQEGVKRAKDRSSKADMLIFILEAKRALEFLSSHTVSSEKLLSHFLHEELGEDYLKSIKANHSEKETLNALILLNKIDLITKEDLVKIKQLELTHSSVCAVSLTDGTGMSRFMNILAGRIKEICCGYTGDLPTITQERHRTYVQNCLQSLLEYDDDIEIDIAIAADKLRRAMNELGKITGKIRVDDILDVIFKDFCIGK
ncbi:tRNA modification GTPase GTPBP3, mitochondrial [Trichonephila inaurata madagascariensis]|uniref:tRNA modification GTPase GTPBP3, mitochondrial n=1 Tax=Trichonephila inaurata madagascariensis TaxID=2747483 RepID=A0A8X6Y529_9ARAC|nr:tRNA modification GTPase GTPBP3, mitochondrial [Trichonephila inaurata madagascariensis]